MNAALPRLKAGTLRFWGEWFGRPHDNIHKVVACDAQHDLLRIQFNEGEILQLWSPRQASIDHQIFKIQSATQVRWEWFAYGRLKTDRNQYFMNFTKVEERIVASTNVDWYTPNVQHTLRAPAVEIV